MIKYKDIHPRSYMKKHFVNIATIQSGTGNIYNEGFSNGFTHRFVAPMDMVLKGVHFSPVIDYTQSEGVRVQVINEVKSATMLQGNVYSACDAHFGVDLPKGAIAYKDACATRYWTTAGTHITTGISGVSGTMGFAAMLEFDILDHTDKRGNRLDLW